MTAPEPKFDAELAWDLQEWIGDQTKQDEWWHGFSRQNIRDLATFLTEKGYSKGGKTGGFSGLLSQLEEVGTKVVDEFGPLIDSLRKTK